MIAPWAQHHGRSKLEVEGVVHFQSRKARHRWSVAHRRIPDAIPPLPQLQTMNPQRSKTTLFLLRLDPMPEVHTTETKFAHAPPLETHMRQADVIARLEDAGVDLSDSV